MKLAVILVCLLSTNQGCPTSDENTEETSAGITERFEIAFGDTLKYDLGYFGDEDRAQILKRPSWNAMSGFCSKGREPLIYCYTPVNEKEGMDTVEFKLGFGSDGSSEPSEEKYIQLIYRLNKD